MTVYSLGLPVESALGHFAGYGLAAVVEHVSGHTCMLRWRDDDEPRFELSCVDVDGLDYAGALAAVAGRLDRADSWVQSTTAVNDRGVAGTFSPRVAIFGQEYWHRLQSDRHRYLDQLTGERRWLDLDLIAGLGEPAYWRFAQNKRDGRPDEGASRWEMKERNRGQEFIQHRFKTLTSEVAGLPVESVDRGLRGLEHAKKEQSATGFADYGPHHCAVVYSALWGIGSFPVSHQISRMSSTACAFPKNILHSRLMLLPVATEFATLSWWRGIVVTPALDVVGRHILASRDDGRVESDLRVGAAAGWLIEHGVRAVIAFPIRKAGSDAAPQRIVLDGTIIPLEDLR